MADKPSEYYWIKFNWSKWDKNRIPQWEPASFDPNVKSWALIGSSEILPESHAAILEVGKRIREPK